MRRNLARDRHSRYTASCGATAQLLDGGQGDHCGAPDQIVRGVDDG